jgi:hypothetical protein
MEFSDISSQSPLGGSSATQARSGDRGQAAGWYRVFVVVAPQDRATLGRWLFGKIRETLMSISATHAWMMEYEADTGVLALMEQVGFRYFRSLTTADGFRAVQMTMDAPFDSLNISN